MRIVITLLLLLITFNIAAAQEKIIDSLKLELNRSKPDTNKVLLLAALTRIYYLYKPDTAILLGQQAYELSQRLNYHAGEALSLNRIAAGYATVGDYAKALMLFTKALNISRDNKDQFGIARAYNNLGDTYLTQGDYGKALDFFKKSISASANFQDQYPKSVALLNVGMCYLRLHQYDSALLYFQHTYAIAKKEKYEDFTGDIERGLGEIDAANNNFSAALNHFNKSVDTYKTADDKQDLSITYLSISGLYQKQKQQDSSVYYGKMSLSTAQAGMYNKGIFDASESLSKLYEGKNDKEAFNYLKLATAAKDSLYSQDKVKQILSISFEEKQHEQEIEAARNESRNQMKLFALLVILGFFLLLAIILYRNNRQKQHANSLLQQQKQEIEKTLSELKITQNQLIQSEKMASLGELTAGIAHEIQNPLNFVNNFSEVSLELSHELKEEINKTALPADEKEAIEILVNDVVQNQEKINYHGKRASAIIKGMLQHSRTSTGKKEEIDINALIDECLRLSYYGLRAKDKAFNANYKTNFDEQIGKVKAVPQDIGRVFLNLFNNAFYAVNEKKKEALAQKGEKEYNPSVSVCTKMLDRTIEIIVRDNGNGIPQNIIDKIFQPFFTTKPTGQGTGLGLSLSYDIVKAHGGEIKVKSKEGEGSEFIILLPQQG